MHINMKWQGHWSTAWQITTLMTSHLALRLWPSLLVWSGGQLSLRDYSGRALWCSIYCCGRRSLSRCLQQSNSLGFGTSTSDTLAHREGWQGIGQSVWSLHGGGGVGRGATCSEGGWGGRNGSEKCTREGNWEKNEKENDKKYILPFLLIVMLDYFAIKMSREDEYMTFIWTF